jgi:hypothetical protein
VLKDDICTLIDVVIVAQFEQTYFLDLVQLKDLSLPMQFKPKKGAIVIDTPLINFFP